MTAASSPATSSTTPRSRAGGSRQNGNGVNVFRAAGVTVRDNIIRRAAFSAVRGNAASNFQVIGNKCEVFGETAMYAEFEYENASFIDNVIDDAANGIAVTNFDVGGHGGIVRGNIVRNIGQRVLSTLTDGSGNGFGISVEADTTATGNTIENCAYAGLRTRLRALSAQCHGERHHHPHLAFGIVVSVVRGGRTRHDHRQYDFRRDARRHCRRRVAQGDERRSDARWRGQVSDAAPERE